MLLNTLILLVLCFIIGVSVSSKRVRPGFASTDKGIALARVRVPCCSAPRDVSRSVSLVRRQEHSDVLIVSQLISG